MELQRKLNLYGLTMIAVGACIGSGIFVTPGQVAAQIPQHNLILLVWLLGGFTALCGALTFAELGGMFPKAGGVYVFLKEAYGPFAAFLYGWVTLLVINTGALAALGVGLVEYLGFIFPIAPSAKWLLTAGIILGLTLVNMAGVHVSQSLSNVLTGLKLAAIAGIIAVGLYYAGASYAQPIAWLTPLPSQNGLINSVLLAFTGVFFSYGGWHHASYLAGETLHPQRTVPRAMMWGALIVTATYLLVNVAYMWLLPLPAMTTSERIAGDALAAVFPTGGQIATWCIAVSIFGTISIYTMSAPRIYYAMAQDGVFFPFLAKVHPHFRTPIWAMGLQALWAVALLLYWKSFAQLITYVTFMDIAFMALAGAAVWMLRRKRPQVERPYRVWGYPVVPMLYILICGAFVLNILVFKPENALAGLVLAAVGGLIYWFIHKQLAHV